MSEPAVYPKRLIEVDLPIKRISAHARREKSIRHGHISTLHIWWARRPLAACRAVICASLWPDPADENCPEAFRNEARKQLLGWSSYERQILLSTISRKRFERARKDPSLFNDKLELRNGLLDFIADFSNWNNSTKTEYLQTSRSLTQAAHNSLAGAPGTQSLVVDPFAGGGAIPLEALRVGAHAFASDLNPLPILLNKIALEYAPRYGSRLVEQVRKSAATLRANAEKELKSYYFSKQTPETPLVYFWGRTIICEGPSCGYTYPLIRSLWLRQKPRRGVAFAFKKNAKTKEIETEIIESALTGSVGQGTSKQGAATCPNCGYTTPVERVRIQLSEKRGGALEAKLLAVGVSKPNEIGKFYRRPSQDERQCLEKAKADYVREIAIQNEGTYSIPREELNHLRGFFNVVLYGMQRWGDLLGPRQALLMVTLTRLIREEHARLLCGDSGLADAVATCLALNVGKVAQYNSSCCRWKPTGETLVDMFGRQAIPMVWDFAEAYPFGGSTGDLASYSESFCNVLEHLSTMHVDPGNVQQASATRHPLADDIAAAMITDPPYYDAIPYADLSDYFYVWLRRMLGKIHPQLLSEPLSPKADEAVTLSHRAAMYRHKDREYFEKMMKNAMTEGRRFTKPDGIGVVVFANKSTSGWEAMLTALVEAGWIVTASWPIDTEMSSRLRAQDSAVLASSVHLVCRPRENPDGSLRRDDIGDWRDVLSELPRRIHDWMPRLADEGVVGADAIFACLGPALEIFSRYSRVEKASGEAVTLREYLEHVWAAVAKEALSVIFQSANAEGFEAEARLTAMWLWTLSTNTHEHQGEADEQNEDEVEELGKTKGKTKGFSLEFDAARKIAQGLGANLEALSNLVEVDGDTASLLQVSQRAKYLFGQNHSDNKTNKQKTKSNQKELFTLPEDQDQGTDTKEDLAFAPGANVLDRVHQSMLLFGSGRSGALKRLLVEDAAGSDAKFWRLAQALSALYPSGTDEKRWIDGVLARKKGLGF